MQWSLGKAHLRTVIRHFTSFLGEGWKALLFTTQPPHMCQPKKTPTFHKDQYLDSELLPSELIEPIWQEI